MNEEMGFVGSPHSSPSCLSPGSLWIRVPPAKASLGSQQQKGFDFSLAFLCGVLVFQACALNSSLSWLSGGFSARILGFYLMWPQGNFVLISSLKNQADKTESFIAQDPVVIHPLQNSQVLWPAAQGAPGVELKPGAPCLREHQNTPPLQGFDSET